MSHPQQKAPADEWRDFSAIVVFKRSMCATGASRQCVIGQPPEEWIERVWGVLFSAALAGRRAESGVRSQETTGADAFEATRDDRAPERGVSAQRNWGKAKNKKSRHSGWKSAYFPTKGIDMFIQYLRDFSGWVAMDWVRVSTSNRFPSSSSSVLRMA